MECHPQHIRAEPLSPFLKWAGGKRKLATTILRLLGPGQRLIEPFVGAGAVFGTSNYEGYLLGDCNPDLINLYRTVTLRLDALIAECRPLFLLPSTREAYLIQRALFNASSRNVARAARFLYLNYRGYNGLCRYNQRGEFNVPFGGQNREGPLPAALLVQWHRQLSRAELACADFEDVMNQACPGDVVYCDPPYVPLRPGRGFTTYAAGGFNWADQLRLAAVARRIAQRGVVVAISNHDTVATRELYAGAVSVPLTVSRHIGSQSNSRKPAAEMIALFGRGPLTLGV